MGWALLTLSTTCFIKANLGGTLSSRTRTLLFSGDGVMWCKSVRLMHNWDSGQSWLTGIETQHLFLWVIYWWNCRHSQTIDYVIVQTPDPFPQTFISRNGLNSQTFRTMNAQNLSTLQVFRSFSHRSKSLFIQSCPKEFIQFLCECILNLLKGNMQSIKSHHVTNIESKVRI